MKITAVSHEGGTRPAVLDDEEFLAFRDLVSCLNPDIGPVLRLSTFLGAGNPAGGGYAGHAEIFDLDGLFRDMYQTPSLDAGLGDSIFGGGKGFDLQQAFLSSAGEAVERGVAAIVGTSPHFPGRRVLGSYDDLVANGFTPVHPSTIRLFSDEQYDKPHFLYRRFETSTPIQWVEATRAQSGEMVFVPSQLVDMVHIYDHGEVNIGYTVSGGLSCHTSYKAALYHGLTEVLERHAVNLSWYTDDRPYRVRFPDEAKVERLAGLPDGYLEQFRIGHSKGLVLLHPSELLVAPTFSMVGIQDWLSRRQYCAGGGCDVVTSSALRKAAAEYGQTRATLGLAVNAPRSAVGRSVEDMFDWQPGRPLAEMTLFFQSIGWYGLPEHADDLDYYLSGPEIDFDDVVDLYPPLDGAASIDERLEVLLATLEGHGIDPFVLDYSHPSWKQLAIVKVYVPALSTPFMQAKPMLGHPTLAHIRQELRQPNGTVSPLPYP